MTKKGFPGLVLVPPSDRTIVRRRIVRWSLVGLAILWGMFTFLSSLAPPNKSDCQPSDAQTSPGTIQEDCNPAATSTPPPQSRLDETSPVTEIPSNVSPVEGQRLLAPPSSESAKPMSEQTTDHPSSAGSSADRNNGTDHTSMVQPEMKATSTQPPPQPAKPTTTADHQATTQSVSTPAPQHPTPPPHTAPDRKVAAQPGNGLVSGPTLNQPQKPTSHTSDHKLATQPPKEPAIQPLLTQHAKAATTTTAHKPTAQLGNGTVPNQAHTKPVASSVHTAPDRKLTTQPGNGIGQPQTSQPTKSVSLPPDHKPTAQPHNESAPHLPSPQAVNPKPASQDRKVSPQLVNGSANTLYTAGTANGGAGQAGHRASHEQPSSPSSHEDTRLAEAGDAFAQYRLGRLYAQQGESQIPEAIKWYKKASNGLRRLAEAGNGQAMYVLGVMYAYGRGVKKDTDQARHWLNQAVGHKITAARPVLASLERD